MIPVKNIYYMLTYAFRVLKKKGYKNMETEDFKNTEDLWAEIITQSLQVQIKRGLDREYLEEQETTPSPRGKIEVTDSIKSMTILQKKLVCSYDVFSVNSYQNRIIKTTMISLLRSTLVDKVRKKNLRRILVFFDNVDVLDIHNINWKIPYNRNNQTTHMIVTICYYAITGLLQKDSDGGLSRLLDFDEQSRSSLFENFVFEYYHKEYEYFIDGFHVGASGIDWVLYNDDGTVYVDDKLYSKKDTHNKRYLLPGMWTDITITYGNKILIIDTKYYSGITQSRYEDTIKIRSAHLYQIFAYVKNKELEKNINDTYEVSGMLLYAGTEKGIQPNQMYNMSGNKIYVKTLNLNCDFSEIKEQLNTIIKDIFHIENPKSPAIKAV